jgi:hypothetical protein
MPDLGPVGTVTRTATDFIKSALRLVGALRSGLNLSGAELTDCQQVLNDMLDAWGVDRTLVYVVPRVTLNQNQATLMLKANQATYTLGNLTGNEDFFLPRPPRLERVSIMYSASQQTPVELAMDMYDDVRWQSVANKSTPSLLPQVCYVEESFPDISLTFWPVPTQANPVVLYLWQALTQFSDLTSQFTFPPGYPRAIRYNLALDLAAEFPCDLTKLPLVQKIAANSLAAIRGLNVKAKEAVCDEAIIGSGGKSGNIYTSTASRGLRN